VDFDSHVHCAALLRLTPLLCIQVHYSCRLRVGRREHMFYRRSARLEIVFSGHTAVDTSILLKSIRKSGTENSFMRFPPYFYFRFDQKWLSVACLRP